MARRTSNRLKRGAAMSARPYKLPFLRREATEQGKLRVTVTLQRSGWVKWLGGPQTFERTFVLDAYGQEVYEACDGRRTVQAIVRGFAGGHKISLAEAELAVTTFLKTLMSKGLVAMAIGEEDQ